MQLHPTVREQHKPLFPLEKIDHDRVLVPLLRQADESPIEDANCLPDSGRAGDDHAFQYGVRRERPHLPHVLADAQWLSERLSSAGKPRVAGDVEAQNVRANVLSRRQRWSSGKGAAGAAELEIDDRLHRPS